MQAIRKKSPTTDLLASRKCGIVTSTHLLTLSGYQAVEILRPGDLVRTMLGDEPKFQPVVWIGRRDVILSKMHPVERPVRIQKNAIADGVPSRDVLLAQDHGILLEGKLFFIKDLVNGRSILWERRCRSVAYWGVQLDRHNIILASALPIESLLPINAPAFTAVRA